MSRSIAPKTIGILTKLSYPSLSGWRIMAWGWHTDTHTDRQTQATIPKGQNWPWVITFTKSHLQFWPFCSGFKSMQIICYETNLKIFYCDVQIPANKPIWTREGVLNQFSLFLYFPLFPEWYSWNQIHLIEKLTNKVLVTTPTRASYGKF